MTLYSCVEPRANVCISRAHHLEQTYVYRITHLLQTSCHLAPSTNMNNAVAPSSFRTSISSSVGVVSKLLLIHADDMAVPAMETLSSADGCLLFARSVLSELSLEDIVESCDSYDELATIQRSLPPEVSWWWLSSILFWSLNIVTEGSAVVESPPPSAAIRGGVVGS